MELDLGERLAHWWQRVTGVWNYVLMTVEESSITVGKVIVALLLLVLGAWMSRRLSRLFARRVLRRFKLEEGAVAALQTLTSYLLLLAFFLWALWLVNIPLTVFTFLGGAVAIGIGFGSQNIVNNFMSGLILIAERPVKVGDLIDIDGTYGRVETIGPRSTRVRSGDNTHVILPNSTLLESKVLNWTVSDNVIRTSMDVGVAYGSDVAEVKRRLEQALAESERVLETPAPEILFIDFGDNALLFRALFWTRVSMPLDQARAQSEVRFRVDALFREAGVEIAFPQRDVHLDAAGPLEVRVVESGSRTRSPDPDTA
jgi:small-conductance mechanosensitive channel